MRPIKHLPHGPIPLADSIADIICFNPSPILLMKLCRYSVRCLRGTHFASLLAGAWLFVLGMGLPASDFASQMKEAEAGNSEAQFLIGRSYDRGENVAQDFAKAREMYEKAAAQGNAKAMNNLGSMYLQGRGVSKDNEVALDWFKKSAECGADRAQVTLGVCLQEGRVLKRDIPSAVAWFERAAQQGNAEAKRRLALLYYDGTEGWEKDYGKAVSVVNPLAEAGDPWAMNTLAAMYEYGHGVPKDDATSVEWLRKAAGAGDGRALFNLGSRHASGHGVKRDIVQACALLETSLKKGEGAARALLSELSPTLTPAQNEEVKRRVEKILSDPQWHP